MKDKNVIKKKKQKQKKNNASKMGVDD